MEVSATDVAVMVVEPTPTAVTVPFVTVATEVSPERQVTLLLLASAGNTVVVKVSLPPTAREREVLLRPTLVIEVEVVGFCWPQIVQALSPQL